jgi:hypothetical protein
MVLPCMHDMCNEKAQFKTYVIAIDGEEVLMGNHNSAKVHKKGTIKMQLTSEKKLILTNVFNVP